MYSSWISRTSKILFQIPRLSVLPLSVFRNSVILPAPKFFSLYNVILCRLPGGARQCPRSGHFLTPLGRRQGITLKREKNFRSGGITGYGLRITYGWTDRRGIWNSILDWKFPKMWSIYLYLKLLQKCSSSKLALIPKERVKICLKTNFLKL